MRCVERQEVEIVLYSFGIILHTKASLFLFILCVVFVVAGVLIVVVVVFNEYFSLSLPWELGSQIDGPQKISLTLTGDCQT